MVQVGRSKPSEAKPPWQCRFCVATRSGIAWTNPGSSSFCRQCKAPKQFCYKRPQQDRAPQKNAPNKPPAVSTRPRRSYAQAVTAGKDPSQAQLVKRIADLEKQLAARDSTDEASPPEHAANDSATTDAQAELARIRHLIQQFGEAESSTLVEAKEKLVSRKLELERIVRESKTPAQQLHASLPTKILKNSCTIHDRGSTSAVRVEPTFESR